MLFFVSLYFNIVGVRQKAVFPRGEGGVFFFFALFVPVLCRSKLFLGIKSNLVVCSGILSLQHFIFISIT